jgi:sirohydrochlorin cobaltochelatase
MREVFRMVESETIYVVPLFISEGYFTRTVIPRELELEGARTLREGRTIYYCDPVGSHPGMTRALLRRAREVAPNVPPEATSLFIVGHGTELNDNSARAAKEQASRIRALGEYAEVVSSYMEEPPLISDWAKLSKHPYVVIVPFFIADGLHSYQDIPVLIGIEAEPGLAASQTGIFRRNPYELRGRKVFYASAIGTEPMIADVILDQVAAFVSPTQRGR